MARHILADQPEEYIQAQVNLQSSYPLWLWRLR
jgi:hypothetical protein